MRPFASHQVLVVESDPWLQHAVARWIEGAGFECLPVSARRRGAGAGAGRGSGRRHRVRRDRRLDAGPPGARPPVARRRSAGDRGAAQRRDGARVPRAPRRGRRDRSAADARLGHERGAPRPRMARRLGRRSRPLSRARALGVLAGGAGARRLPQRAVHRSGPDVGLHRVPRSPAARCGRPRRPHARGRAGTGDGDRHGRRAPATWSARRRRCTSSALALLPQPLRQPAETLAGLDRVLALRHPDVVFELLSSMPGLAEAATVVRAAHERFDGAGHPRGLSGLEIPMGARLIAVACAVDRIATGDAGRPGLRRAGRPGRPDALAGTALDPDLVRVWAGQAERAARRPVRAPSGRRISCRRQGFRPAGHPVHLQVRRRARRLLGRRTRCGSGELSVACC